MQRIELQNLPGIKPGNDITSAPRYAVPLVTTLREAASILTISERKICDLVSSGKLRSKKIGRRRVIRRADIENFLAR